MRPTASRSGFIAMLALCAVPAVASAEDAKALVVIDLRPPEEKDASALTELTGKCNKDVYRIPDVASDPLKVDVLKADLEGALIDGGAGKTLTVLNWSVYYNKQVQKSGGSLSSVGIGGYNIPGKSKERKAGSACSKRESTGGWYQASELDSVYFPLVSEFTGTFGGKPINVRVVYSPHRKLDGKFAGADADTEALLEAVHKTSESVLSALSQ
jgi:hypothetical protein